jgi:uncharacterized protein
VELLKKYDPDRIVLFGSRARGTADEYSDYDIVLVKETGKSFVERLQDMVPYLAEFGRAAGILVYTPDEMEAMRESAFGWTLHKEGVVLYERPAD